MTKPGELSEEDMMGDAPIKEKSKEKLIASEDRQVLEDKLTKAEEVLLSERLLFEDKLKKSEEKLLHALADLDNLRRQSEKRVLDAHKYGVSKLLEELIPVLDSLEQSLMVKESVSESVKSMRDGMEMTLMLLLKVLEKFGVKVINPEVNKEMFNPEWHEVMMAQESTEVSANIILGVMQKGYQLHERLVRPARVIVAKAPIEKS